MLCSFFHIREPQIGSLNEVAKKSVEQAFLLPVTMDEALNMLSGYNPVQLFVDLASGCG